MYSRSSIPQHYTGAAVVAGGEPVVVGLELGLELGLAAAELVVVELAAAAGAAARSFVMPAPPSAERARVICVDFPTAW